MTLLQWTCLQLLGVPEYGKATKYELKWRCPFCFRLTFRCLPHKPPHRDKWKCDGCIPSEGTGIHVADGRVGDEMDLITFVFAEPWHDLITRVNAMWQEYNRSGAAHARLTRHGSEAGYEGHMGTSAYPHTQICARLDVYAGPAGSVEQAGAAAPGGGPGGLFSPRGRVAPPPATDLDPTATYAYELDPLRGELVVWRVDDGFEARMEEYRAGFDAWKEMTDEERRIIHRARHIARRYDVKLETLAGVSQSRPLPPAGRQEVTHAERAGTVRNYRAR
jgi:hypothetical protein